MRCVTATLFGPTPPARYKNDSCPATWPLPSRRRRCRPVLLSCNLFRRKTALNRHLARLLRGPTKTHRGKAQRPMLSAHSSVSLLPRQQPARGERTVVAQLADATRCPGPASSRGRRLGRRGARGARLTTARASSPSREDVSAAEDAKQRRPQELDSDLVKTLHKPPPPAAMAAIDQLDAEDFWKSGGFPHYLYSAVSVPALPLAIDDAPISSSAT